VLGSGCPLILCNRSLSECDDNTLCIVDHEAPCVCVTIIWEVEFQQHWVSSLNTNIYPIIGCCNDHPAIISLLQHCINLSYVLYCCPSCVILWFSFCLDHSNWLTTICVISHLDLEVPINAKKYYGIIIADSKVMIMRNLCHCSRHSRSFSVQTLFAANHSCPHWLSSHNLTQYHHYLHCQIIPLSLVTWHCHFPLPRFGLNASSVVFLYLYLHSPLAYGCNGHHCITPPSLALSSQFHCLLSLSSCSFRAMPSPRSGTCRPGCLFVHNAHCISHCFLCHCLLPVSLTSFQGFLLSVGSSHCVWCHHKDHVPWHHPALIWADFAIS